MRRGPGSIRRRCRRALCTLKASPLDNLATMARGGTARGVELGPTRQNSHGAAELFDRQLAAGACAVTVATIGQARTYRAFGASALILANELVDPPDCAGSHRN